MTNIEFLYATGRNLYVVLIFNDQFWNKDTLAFENYNQANWAHYAMPMAEKTSSGYYFLAYPDDIPEGTLSTELIYQQNGSTPALPALPGGDTALTLGQSQGTNVQNINGSGTASIQLAKSAETILSGAAIAGTLSTTQMSTDLTNTETNAYNGRVVIWTSGVLIGQASNITAYNPTNGVLTFTAKTDAPAAADTFIIV